MKWQDPLVTQCSECGRQTPVSVAALRSLLATCPHCGASFAADGERMLAEEARIGRQIDLSLVAIELEEHKHWVILDCKDGNELSLEGLIRTVAGLLHPAADCEARAVELVTEAARRVAPLLLSEQAMTSGSIV